MIDDRSHRIHTFEPQRKRDWLQNQVLAFFDANDDDEYLMIADVALKFGVSTYKAGLTLRCLAQIGILECKIVQVENSKQRRFHRKRSDHV